MLTTIKGTYKDGEIRLEHDPHVTGEAAVVVTFLEEASDPGDVKNAQIMTSGMLAVPGRRMSTLEDFEASQHDDSRWDRD